MLKPFRKWWHRKENHLDTLKDFVENNKLSDISELLDDYPDLVSQKFLNGLTILEVALYVFADDVKLETFKVLVKKGGKPNQTFKDWGYKSALHFAAMGMV